MATQGAQVAVGTVPVALASGGTNGVSLLIQNTSATTAFLGGGTVEGTLGAQLAGTYSLGWYLEQGEDLYAVTASGTATIHVLRGGVSQ